MRKVKFVDLDKQHAPLRPALFDAAKKVIESGAYIGGPEVKSFEKEMASWLGVEEICAAACATSGLFSVMKCMGIGVGDEVITTVHTAIATAEAISLTGAKVVFCDIGENSFNIDFEQAEKKVTSRTKAIMPVHLYGQPADIDKARAIAEKHKLFLIEDCAQAQGAKYKDKKVGTYGDAAVFSFFPSKNLGGFGDGGAVTAKNKDLLRKIRMFSNHGRESKYYHEFEGINSRLDALQAALLRVCLPHLDEWNMARRKAASWYDSRLKNIRQVKIPQVLPGTEPVYHLYVIIVPDREALIKYLKDNGIDTSIHYPYSLNVLPAYAHLKQGEGHFPRAEYACGHMLSLPISPAIAEDDVDYVCETVKRFFEGK